MCSSDLRKLANERMWARADAKQDKEERKAIAQAKREGTGLVLAKRPRKKADPKAQAKKTK